MVDKNVSWLDIPMNDSFRVGEIKSNKYLDDVTLDIFERQFRPKSSKVGVFDVLKDQRRCPCAWVGYLVVHVYNIWPTLYGLQDLYLPPNF